MFEVEKPGGSKAEIYTTLQMQARGLLAGETDPIANAANLAALLYHGLEQVNWAGFYLFKNGELVVGPFQGKPACVRIALGRGVCGTAAARRETVCVEDVDRFAGHIPCDGDSKSEIVVPLVHAGELFGVMDIDSPVTGRFDAEDQAGLEELAKVFVDSLA